MRRLGAVAAGLFLLAGAVSSVSAQPVPADQPEPVSLDTLVGALLAQGKTDDAQAVVDQLRADRPDDPQLLFLDGMVAMARGDRKHAIALFRKILADHPRSERVRLELGRAFFLEGDYGNAYRQFQFARAANLPDAVRANVDQYLYAIRQQKSLSYSLDLAVAPDTNLNGGTAAREVTLYGLPFELSDDARRTSGVGLELSAGGEWAPRLAEGTRLRLGTSVLRREYSGSNFDDMQIAAYAGPRFVTPRRDLSLLATANVRWYGARPYHRAVGGRADGTFYLSPRLGIMLSLGLQWVDYRQTPDRNGALASLTSGAFYALGPSSSVTAKAGLSRQTARDRSFANWSGYLAAGYYRDLSAGFSVYAEPSLSLTRYDMASLGFGLVRSDTAISTMVTLLNRKIVLARFTPRIAYTFTHQHSTIPIFSFDRNRLELGLTTSF